MYWLKYSGIAEVHLQWLCGNVFVWSLSYKQHLQTFSPHKFAFSNESDGRWLSSGSKTWVIAQLLTRPRWKHRQHIFILVMLLGFFPMLTRDMNETCSKKQGIWNQSFCILQSLVTNLRAIACFEIKHVIVQLI